MSKITQITIDIFLFLFVVGLDISLHAKGYMALKHDLGYEAEHQRPENKMGQATSSSDKRNFAPYYGMTTNPGSMYNTIENAASYEEMSADENGNNEDENFENQEANPMQLESSEPEPASIANQTIYVVNNPYEDEYE